MKSRVGLTLLGVLIAANGRSLAQENWRASVDSSGLQGDGRSDNVSLSADGRWVAFESDATNLVPGDTNGSDDVFVHDLASGITTRVSVDSSGQQANGRSESPSISADGRFVAFAGSAGNLVAADSNGILDVFVHDRQSGLTRRVSIDSAGSEANGVSSGAWISADGRIVAFHSYASDLVPGDTNSVHDIFVHDTFDGSTTRVSVSSSGSQGNSVSLLPSVSGDGRSVGFSSIATNLVLGDNNGSSDVFLHDRLTGETTRVSVSSSGVQGSLASEAAAISADGRYIAFHSRSNNLVPADSIIVDVYLRDRLDGRTSRTSISYSGYPAFGASFSPSIAADGSRVAFESDANNIVLHDTNLSRDVFVHHSCVPVGTTYCTANASSTGDPALISACGSASSAMGTLRLTAVPVPTSTGLFFHGPNPSQLPFGNGFLCTTGDIARGGLLYTLGGYVVYNYDNSNAKHSLQAYAGSTRNFQYWFRDPMGGGALFNTSDAIAITILP